MNEQYGLFEIVLIDGRTEADFSSNPEGRSRFVAGGLNWWAERVGWEGRYTTSRDKLVKLNGGSAYINRALLAGLIGNNAQYYHFTERDGVTKWFDLAGYGDERLMQAIDDHTKYERRSVTERRVQLRNAQVVNWIEGHWGRVQFTEEEMAKWQNP